jgi:protein translocase SecG subunit
MLRYSYRMTQQILSFFQIGVAILLGTAILLQQKGQGLSGAFGGGDGNFTRSKRGFEKTLLISTIILSILFVTIGIIRIIITPAIRTDPAPTTTTTPLELETQPSNPDIPISAPGIDTVTEPIPIFDLE